jgi:hypothetical protein
MDQPINYSQDVVSPFEAATKGLAFGVEMRNMENNKQLAAQQQAQANRRAQEMAQDTFLLGQKKNKSANDFSSYILKYPEQEKAAKAGWEMLQPEQQQEELNVASRAFMAARNGDFDEVKSTLEERAKVFDESKMPDRAAGLRALIRSAEIHPESMETTLGQSLAAILGSDKFSAAFGTIEDKRRQEQMLPSEISISRSNAAIKAEEANNMGVKNTLENKKTAEETESLVFKRKLDAQDQRIKMAGTDIEREKLIIEREKMVGTRDEKNQLKQDTIQVGIDSADSTLAVIEKINGAKSWESSWFGPGTATGALAGVWPGSNEYKTLKGMLETLKSNVFMDGVQKMRGMGALSNAEGAKIEKLMGNIDIEADPIETRKTVGEIQRLTKSMRDRYVNKLSSKSPVAFIGSDGGTKVTESQINELIKKNPGSTKADVLKFLESRNATTGSF